MPCHTFQFNLSAILTRYDFEVSSETCGLVEKKRDTEITKKLFVAVLLRALKVWMWFFGLDKNFMKVAAGIFGWFVMFFERFLD